MKSGVQSLLDAVPEGFSLGRYRGKKYGMTKTIFNEGKSCKFYAEELGGTDFVSLNLYLTGHCELLKPCEMPAEKVIAFLEEVDFSESN